MKIVASSSSTARCALLATLLCSLAAAVTTNSIVTPTTTATTNVAAAESAGAMNGKKPTSLPNNDTVAADDSVYVPVPIAAPVDVGDTPAQGAASAASSVGDTDVVVENDSSATNHSAAAASASKDGAPWAGNWPKKFQIGYIKQSDLHQVLVESLKANPFPVSKLAAAAAAASTKLGSPSLTSSTATPPLAKAKRQDSYTSHQSPRVTFDDKLGSVFVPQTSNSMYQQSPASFMLQPQKQPFSYRQQPPPQQHARFQPPPQPPHQQHQYNSVFVSQAHLPMLMRNQQQYYNSRPLQQHQAPVYQPTSGFPFRPFGAGAAAAAVEFGSHPFAAPPRQHRSLAKQPVYTFHNYQQQAQSDLNSINLNLAPHLHAPVQQLQQQHSMFAQQPQQQQQQLTQQPQQKSMLLSSLRTSGGKLSPWRPVEAANTKQAEQQQQHIDDDSKFAANNSNSQADANLDDSDYGFGSARDSTPASVGGVTNVHPMINNYYGATSDSPSSSSSSSASKSGSGKGVPALKGNNSTRSAAKSNATTAVAAGGGGGGTLKSPMSVARHLNSTTNKGAADSSGADFSTTQTPQTASTLAATTTLAPSAETADPESESVSTDNSSIDDAPNTTTAASINTRNADGALTTPRPTATTTTTSTNAAATTTTPDGSSSSSEATTTAAPAVDATTAAPAASELPTLTAAPDSNANDDSSDSVSAVGDEGVTTTSSRLERELIKQQPSSGKKKARSSERLVDAPNQRNTKSSSAVATSTQTKSANVTTAKQAAAQMQQKKPKAAGKRGKSSARNLRLPASNVRLSKSAKLVTTATQSQQQQSSQQLQFANMSPAQAQSTAQTLASLLLARCMSSTSCAHLLDVCATKQGSFQLPSETMALSATSTAAKPITVGGSNASTAAAAKWALPSGLAANSVMALAAALDADKALRMFAAWKDAVDNTLDFNGEFGYTLILPSNEALERLPQATLDNWLRNADALDAVIAAHVLDSVEQIDVVKSSRLIRERGLHFNQHRDKTWTINGKRVVYANQPAPGGGRIHVIDGVLESPLAAHMRSRQQRHASMSPSPLTSAAKLAARHKPLDIMETLKQCDKFDGFVTLAEGTGLGAILKSDGPLTVFVPSNEALMKIPDNELDIIKSNSTALREFLLYHVVNGSYFSQDLRDGQQLSSMLNAKPIEVGLRVDGCSRRLVDANTSPMRKPDIATKNGVIHILDWYLSVRDEEWCEPTDARVEVVSLPSTTVSVGGTASGVAPPFNSAGGSLLPTAVVTGNTLAAATNDKDGAATSASNEPFASARLTATTADNGVGVAGGLGDEASALLRRDASAGPQLTSNSHLQAQQQLIAQDASSLSDALTSMQSFDKLASS